MNRSVAILLALVVILAAIIIFMLVPQGTPPEDNSDTGATVETSEPAVEEEPAPEPEPQEEQAVAGGLAVSGAYAPRAPEGMRNAAIFFTLSNDGAGRQLTSAATNVSSGAELHETVTQNGVAHMRAVDMIPVGSGESVTFGPNGLHVMMVGLDRALQPGDAIMLSLGFADGGTVEVEVPVTDTSGN